MGKSGPSKLQEQGVYPIQTAGKHSRPISSKDDIGEILSGFTTIDQLIDTIIADLKSQGDLSKGVRWEQIKANLYDFLFTLTYATGPLGILWFARIASAEPDYARDTTYWIYVQILDFIALWLAFSFRDIPPFIRKRLATKILVSHFRKRSASALNTVDITREKSEP